MATEDDITELFGEAIGAFEALLEEAKANYPPDQPLACGTGCSHCCYQPEISVTAVETFRLASYLKEYLEPAEIMTLIENLGRAEGKKTSWPLSPCPLLKNGHCSVYDVRPLICRGFSSISGSACEKAWRGEKGPGKAPAYSPQLQAAHLTVGMIEKSSLEAGLEPFLGDLRPALLTALTVPDARQRWLNGEPVFEMARQGPSSFGPERKAGAANDDQSSFRP